MKTISEYTIYCTPDQTRKSLELGAPLFKYTSIPNFAEVIEVAYCEYYEIPTAEEMIGWLEEQGVLIQIEPINGMHYYWLLSTKECTEKPDKYSWVTQYVTPNYKEIPSRKEATIAAIDAALEHLKENNYNNNRREK